MSTPCTSLRCLQVGEEREQEGVALKNGHLRPTWMWEVQIMQEQLSATCKLSAIALTTAIHGLDIFRPNLDQ